MNQKITLHLLALCCLLGLISKGRAQTPAGKAQLAETAEELRVKDSLIFDIAFRTCNVQQLPAIYSRSFIMLHDDGLSRPVVSQSYTEFEKSIHSICERKAKGVVMRREVVPGSLQVFLNSPAEAVQTGVQRFYAGQAQGNETWVEESKFLRSWHKEHGSWKLYQETDYLINDRPTASAANRYVPDAYNPASHPLYQTVVRLDSLYFDTYNHSKPAAMDSLTADNIEFYHDRTGLTTSKTDLLQSIQKKYFWQGNPHTG